MLAIHANQEQGTTSMKPKPAPMSTRRRTLILNGALLLGMPAAKAVPPPGLRAITLLAPLFGMERQGRPSGIFVDVMGELSRVSGIEIASTLAPKVRGQVMLEAGRADLMMGFDNDDLLAHARHVAPVASFDVGILARAGVRLRSLSDLRGRTVGQLRSADYSKAYAQDGAILKYSTNSMSQMMKMLALGRVDAVIGVRESLYHALESEGIGLDRIGDFLPLDSRQAWLHYSNATYSAATADKLAAAMRQMRADGIIAAIIQRYVGK